MTLQSLSFIISIVAAHESAKQYARVAQLVEHHLAKVGVAGSSPVSRSFYVKGHLGRDGFLHGKPQRALHPRMVSSKPWRVGLRRLGSRLRSVQNRQVCLTGEDFNGYEADKPEEDNNFRSYRSYSRVEFDAFNGYDDCASGRDG